MSGQQHGRPDGRMYWGNIAEPVEADVGWRIANTVDWQLQRLERNSSTGTAVPYGEGIASVDSQHCEQTEAPLQV